MKVGLMGGAFDPPHLAHRALAEAALTQLGLDRLHLVPTGQAWHKARALSPAAHRLQMCRLAFGDLARVVIDPREMERPGPSYSVETLHELADVYPGASLYLILGADQLLAFKHWSRWREILSLAQLAVARRPSGDAPADPAAADQALADGPAFVPLAMPLQAISATAVRDQIARHPVNAEWTQWVSEAVAGYISHHHLYQTAP